MRDRHMWQRIWKRLVCVVMTAVITGSLLAGCSASDREPAAQTGETADTAVGDEHIEAVEADTTEVAGDAATETNAEVLPEADAGSTEARDETDPATGDAADAREDELMPFVYVGNAEEGKICTAQAYAYARDGHDIDSGNVVVIPAYVIADETEDGNQLQILANIMVYLFELDGTTLRCTAGGSYPCRIQSAGGEITQVETAYTDEDTLTLCGGDESLVQIMHDDDALATSLRNNVGMYVNNYGYSIDSYEIGGETYAINP